MDTGQEFDDEDENWSTAYYEDPPKELKLAKPQIKNPKIPSLSENVLQKLQKDQGSPQASNSHHRVIIHIDLDCFYAQVEMLENPSLRDKPLGVQQKYLMVTSNYVARARGVPKCCGIQEARRACPELVLVNGEDLTRYREMSYRVTELFQKYTKLVERLGFDENFLDVTERIQTEEWHRHLDMEGHVYGDNIVPCSCGCLGRLTAGSHLAAEIRRRLHSELGLTSCAGVAHNKLLAKLVGATHKPNQQTTIFPGSARQLMLGLGSVTRIPGIGSSMARRLEHVGVATVQELMDGCPKTLAAEFGAEQVAWLKNVAIGVDVQEVQKTKPPQSMSDEDSFKKCSSTEEAFSKMDSLLESLLQRVLCDGRTPRVLRVTVRRVVGQDRRRESRQCPVPAHVFNSFSHGVLEVTRISLLELAKKLFCRVIDISQPFHVTIINVCLTKFSDNTSPNNKISSFFHPKALGQGYSGSQTHVGAAAEQATPPVERIISSGKRDRNGNHLAKSALVKFFIPKQLSFEPQMQENEGAAEIFPANDSDLVKTEPDSKRARLLTLGEHGEKHSNHHLCNAGSLGDTAINDRSQVVKSNSGYPASSDWDASEQLKTGNLHTMNTSPSVRKTAQPGQGTDPCSALEMARTGLGTTHTSCPDMAWTGLDPPSGVDPSVFQELPLDLQSEVLKQYRVIQACSLDKMETLSELTSEDNKRESADRCDTNQDNLFENHWGVKHDLVGENNCSTYQADTQKCQTQCSRADYGDSGQTSSTRPRENPLSLSGGYRQNPPSGNHGDTSNPREIPSDMTCPAGVDMAVFTQLPPDIQNELCQEYSRKSNRAQDKTVKKTYSPAGSKGAGIKSKKKSTKLNTSGASITSYFTSGSKTKTHDKSDNS